MDSVIKRYSGRDFTQNEINSIKLLIKNSPALGRAQLSRVVCEELNWRKHNGEVKEMSCRVAMLKMHREGIIALPAPRNKSPGMVKKKIEHNTRTDVQPEIKLPVHELGEIIFETVLNRQSASLWNEYIERYHYLGHKTLPGAQIRYIVSSADKVIALLGFGAAAWKIAPRDNYIGWDPITKEKNLHYIVNNARFLILPWVKSKNLASKLLAMSARRLQTDWFERYRYKPVLLETFVQVPRFTGGCYKAANWIKVGRTTGRGKLGVGKKVTLPKKDIWVYPLRKKFKKILCD